MVDVVNCVAKVMAMNSEKSEMSDFHHEGRDC